MKIIKIENCSVCPYRSSYPKNLEGVSRVPYCYHHDAPMNNELPYVLAAKSLEPTAAPKNTVPDWCPLGDG